MTAPDPVASSFAGANPPRILMTGGYGCIGSWVARAIVRAGGEVWMFDLKEDTHRLDRLIDAEEMGRVHFVPGDVSDAAAVLRAVDDVGASHLLHLAGFAGCRPAAPSRCAGRSSM